MFKCHKFTCCKVQNIGIPTPTHTLASLQVMRFYPSCNTDLLAFSLYKAAYLDCLKRLRWPNGFFCPLCGHLTIWRMGGGGFWCVQLPNHCGCGCGNLNVPPHELVCSRLGIWHLLKMLSPQNLCISFSILLLTIKLGRYYSASAHQCCVQAIFCSLGWSRSTRFLSEVSNL